MNHIQNLYLEKLCLKYNANYQIVIQYIQIFKDMLEELNGNIPDTVVRTYTWEEYTNPAFKIFFHYIANMSGLTIDYCKTPNENFKIILNMSIYDV